MSVGDLTTRINQARDRLRRAREMLSEARSTREDGFNWDDGRDVGELIGGMVGRRAGSQLGARGGALAGAAIGTAVAGPVGTVVGGIAGGIAGWIVGGEVGEDVGGAVGGAVGEEIEDAIEGNPDNAGGFGNGGSGGGNFGSTDEPSEEPSGDEPSDNNGASENDVGDGFSSSNSPQIRPGSTEDLLQGATYRGEIRNGVQYDKPGGIQQANTDFDQFTEGQPVNSITNGANQTIRVGELEDGRTVVVRPGSSRSPNDPTVEIMEPGQPTIKIRYDDERF